MTEGLLGGEDEVLPPELLRCVVVQPHHVLRYLPGGELCLAHVAKVSG